MDEGAVSAAPTASKRSFTVTRATPTQIKALLDVFEKTPVTTPPILEQLAKETGLTKKWISSWFTRQRKKMQQAYAAKATTTIAGGSEARSTPGDSSTLEVKREICESLIAPPAPPAPKKKRQRKTAPSTEATGTSTAKKRKVDVANGDTGKKASTSTTATAKHSSSIFEKLKVKVERYTPEPEVPSLENDAGPGHLYPDSTLNGPTPSVRPSANAATVSGPVPIQPIIASVKSSMAPVATRLANEKPSDARTTRRACSPSAVAMKSRRQRVQYAGEGPVLNTRFLHHGAAAVAFEPKLAGAATAPPGIAPIPVAYQNTDAKFALNPAVFPYHPEGHLPASNYVHNQTSAPFAPPLAVPLPNRIASLQYSAGVRPCASPKPELYAMPSGWNGEGGQQPFQVPQVHEVDTFEFQSNASPYQIAGKPWANEPSGLHMQERPTNIEERYTEDHGPHAQVPEFLDPLHAPLKHLTGILEPVCKPLGGYEALLDLEGKQRQVVMEKLLDEEMGINDPFKAAMGLVLASKMGLQWE